MKMIRIFIEESSSDVAHFWLNGFVNKQNTRYWSDSNPHALHESPLHSEKTTAWCGLWAGGVIGRYFFCNDQDRHVTVNGNRYRAMITEYFWPQMTWMTWTWRTCGSNRMSQSVYFKPSLENMLPHEMVQSVGGLSRAI